VWVQQNLHPAEDYKRDDDDDDDDDNNDDGDDDNDDDDDDDEMHLEKLDRNPYFKQMINSRTFDDPLCLDSKQISRTSCSLSRGFGFCKIIEKYCLV